MERAYAETLGKLIYRNQFVLGPAHVDELTGWKKIEIKEGGICLTVHRELNACQVFEGNKSLTLLGYILDAENPELGDADILRRLVRKLSGIEDFYEQTYPLGGRWVMIASDGNEIRLFNDAAGLRQVFYTDIRSVKDIWCASQPALIAEVLNLEMAGYALDFINSYHLMKDREYRFPGESSPYSEIRHLLPNHSLDLKTGLCKRYWPAADLPRLSPEEALPRISSRLSGLIRSASSRFDLVLSITSGLDSRLVLAASREVRHKMEYLTLRKLDMSMDHPDVRIPSQLLSVLGLAHHVLSSRHITDIGFLEVYKKSAPLAHDVWAPDAQAIYEFFGHRRVALTGTACEIARLSFRESIPEARWKSPTARDLSNLQHMGEHPFSVYYFQKWLDNASERYNLELLDLFEWEQGHGNWAAMCQLEFDSAWRDIFTPYNCRTLLTDMLSVEPKFRKAPKNILYKRLIRHLWPETLQLPINPHKESGVLDKIKSNLKKGLSLFGIR